MSHRNPSLDLSFLKPPDDGDTKIPAPKPEKTQEPPPEIPDMSYLQKDLQPLKNQVKSRGETKYEKEFDAFCKWAALPSNRRKPKTVKAFEARWGIPSGYTEYFRRRDDYNSRRMTYFYDWFMDLWPDLVDKAFVRAMGKSTADFKVLAEMVAKNMDISKPKVNVAPMVLVGVPQEKLDKLFTPKSLENVQDAQDGEIVK